MLFDETPYLGSRGNEINICKIRRPLNFLVENPSIEEMLFKHKTIKLRNPNLIRNHKKYT